MAINYLPELFEISYKHEFNGTKSIKLMNNTLIVNDPNPEMIDINRIDEEKWIEFLGNIEPKIVIGDKIYSVLEELYKSIEELIS